MHTNMYIIYLIYNVPFKESERASERDFLRLLAPMTRFAREFRLGYGVIGLCEFRFETLRLLAPMRRFARRLYSRASSTFAEIQKSQCPIAFEIQSYSREYF